MRIRFAKFIATFIILINIIVVYITLKLFLSFSSFESTTEEPIKLHSTKSTARHISKLITVVIREFELQENDVTATIQSFTSIFPNLQILIVCDSLPYPPLELTLNPNKNIKLINLSFNLSKPYIEHYPLIHLKTKYALFVPDSTRLPNRQVFQTLLAEYTKHPEQIASIPVGKNTLNCLRVTLNVRQWSTRYDNIRNTSCDAVVGRQVILVETDLLKTLPNAFLLPFPQSLYLQTTAQGFKVRILNSISFLTGKPLFRSHHSQWKLQQLHSERQRRLYARLKLKQVTVESGAVEWYGCGRDTPRCFGTVIDSVPSYLYEGRWTPPCCLANLRRTARHVFNCLDDGGVRYWLETGSLLGAMRGGDVLPWDHDVDIGMYSEDIGRSLWLEKAKNKPVIDSKGYLWEKATEGNFFRVHFSKVNRIYVNIFPFNVKNGTMVRDSWYTSHRNMEFPDHFLHPMSSIEFLGRHVPGPNNIRDFLELKYGKGAIENPRYPDPNRLQFP